MMSNSYSFHPFRFLQQRKFLAGALLLVASSLSVGGGRQRFRLTGQDFIVQSEAVFVGRLIRAESYESMDGLSLLTRYVFQVEQRIKGQPGDLTEVDEYGGTVGDLTLTVSHTARYLRGQEYLIFTYQDALARQRTFAGPLGGLPVVSSQSGHRVVRIYPTHPLASLLGLEKNTGFPGLVAVSQELRGQVERSSHEIR
ncbi:MAG: hypothetical protein ACE5JX_16015 [Acidobacteriota bacterium]